MRTDNNPVYLQGYAGTEIQNLDKIYLDNYTGLYQYACTIVNDESIAEEMIHQVFLKILEKNEPIAIHTSLKAYLYRSVNNECLNHLKHQKVKELYKTHAKHATKLQTENPSDKLQYQELQQRLREALNQLPEQCRTIFQLSRFEELKYAEIAGQLGLSVKTVENQISKALKRLRTQLAEFLTLIFLLVMNSVS